VTVAAALIARDASGWIGRTIASVRPHVAAVAVWLDDRTADDTAAAVERIAAESGAPVTIALGTFEDFAQARNESFALVPPEHRWIIWLDDDLLVHGENLPGLAAEAQAVGAHWIEAPYDYSDLPDGTVEVTTRARVVRREAARWVGAIHEDLVPYPSRDVVPVAATADAATLLVRHLRREPRPPGHYLDAMREATRDLERTPLAYLHLGNELLVVGDAEGAAAALDRFIGERHDLRIGPEHNWARIEALERAADARERLGDPATAAAFRSQASRERAAGDAHIAALRAGRQAATGRKRIGRNDPCWCRSGKKFKKCHGA